MLTGIERLVDLTGPRSAALAGADRDGVVDAVQRGDAARLGRTDGHFAAVARDGQTVRLARTIGLPLRYFVAKMFHGPFLVVPDRIARLYDYCCEQTSGGQLDPLYTRMVPAHYLVEIEQVGCPHPRPRCHPFFNPAIGHGDAGDETPTAYTREPADPMLSSVLKHPRRYQGGWRIEAIQRSLTSSGGLSRAYVRTYAPAQRLGFTAFSPYTDLAALAAVLAI